MQIGKYQFIPRLWAVVVTLVLTSVFIRLGVWQLERANEKRTFQNQQEVLMKKGNVNINKLSSLQDVFEYQNAEVAGKYLSDKVILLDNKPYNGVHGYHVITPFKVKNTEKYILVNRGWIPMKVRREDLPKVDTSGQQQVISGMIKYPSSQFKLGEAINENNQWPWRIQWIEIEHIAKQLHVELLPFIILQEKQENSGFIRDWKIVVSPPEKNVSYAVQWFSFAIVLLIIFIVVNTRKIRSE